jgi:NADH dehydrogenase [ubiquinone] 1 alpha subcomplex assembly factor 7
MSALLEIIKARILTEGPMDLGEYMTLCLSHIEHGYYMTRDPLGVGGDFTTAPEISQLFGEMIGVWLADVWAQMGKPSEFVLLECGPGRGTLMADILRSTKKVSGFHEAAQVHLMEISSVLMESQSKTLTGYDTRWISDLTQLDSPSPVLVVANEFLDALPVRQLERKGAEVFERMVSLLPDQSLGITLKPIDDHLAPNIKGGSGDGIIEISPVLNQFMRAITNLLKKQKGAALFIDYGHAKTGMGDTIQAVRSHRFENIFDTPGHADLTAHIDFENVKNIAKTEGCTTHGAVSQGGFLRALGIEVRAQMLKFGVSDEQAEQIESGLNRLIDTEQMGILFKVIALCDDPKITPAGFDEV